MMQRKLIMPLAIWHVFSVGGQREMNTLAVAQFQEVEDVQDNEAK